jgi:pyruvate/2-oxoglutarate dehydrogenase complex dihydrolipoamide acyltransferase (E2) component
MTGVSFTITSLDNYGIAEFPSIIDSPQVAILGVGRITDRFAVHQSKIIVRSLMVLSPAFDHHALVACRRANFSGP